MATNHLLTSSSPMENITNKGEAQSGFSKGNSYRSHIRVNPSHGHVSKDSSILTHQNNLNHNNTLHSYHDINTVVHSHHSGSNNHPKRQRRSHHYKNMNHHGIINRRKEKEPEMVERRNERERMRVRLVNDAFRLLRSHIPVDPRQKKLSKVNTLRLAIQYIKYLQRLIDTNPPAQTS